MDGLTGIFRPDSIVKRLCDHWKSDWKQGDEDDQWGSKAIESLLKKLKSDKEQGLEKGQGQLLVEKLERALNYPDQPSECVTINRSLDGRLQVNHRKGLPHVIYCRVWRWPDLQSHQEIKNLPCCNYPFSNKQTKICINPYHYVRDDDAILAYPPVLVPRYNEDPHRNKTARWLSRLFPKTVFWHRSPANHNNYNGSPFSNTSLNQQLTANAYGPIPPDDQMQIDAMSLSSAHSNHMMIPATDCMEVDMMNNNSNMNSLVNAFQPDPELTHWCTISYYELNSRVGEFFSVRNTTSSVIIDGFTAPSNDNRICLGLFTNVNRSQTIQKARDSIGEGIELTLKNGEVYVKCRSVSSVHVQSTNSNYFRGFHPSTVCKVPSGFSLQIFDPQAFQQTLMKAVEAYRIASHIGDDDKLSAEAEKLASDTEKMCLIRISFARGWGSEYQRSDITGTPCWIEIRLNQPLQWYDRMIVQRRRPLIMSSLT